MYCDYGDLSYDFTVSFRKAHPFQLVSQIKVKNEKNFC